MNILKLNNFQVKNTSNNVNKYIQNPISFKSQLKNDTFEHTAAAPDNEIEQEKLRVRNKVDEEIAVYKSEIAKIDKELRIQKKEKRALIAIATNKELAVELDTCILNYLDAQELKPLITKKNIEKGLDTDKIAEIIINYPESDSDIFENKQPSEQELLKAARRIIRQNSEKNLRKNCERLIKEFCQNNSVNIKDKSLEFYINRLLETMNESNDNFIASLSDTFDRWYIKDLESDKIREQFHIDSLNKEVDEYFFQLENNPDCAAYYDPSLSYSEKEQKLIDSGKFIEPDYKAYPEGLFGTLSGFGLLNYFEYTNFLYTKDEENKKTLSMLSGKENKLFTKKDIINHYKIANRYRLSPAEIDDLELPQIKFESKNKIYGQKSELVLYDLSDSATIEKLEKALKRKERTIVKKSKYSYNSFWEIPEEKDIPAKELQRLGYGDVKTIRKLIKEGILPGTIEEIQCPEGIKYKTTVNLADGKTPAILEELRKRTPLLTLSELSKELGITQKNLLEMIKNDEVDIIDEYIFIYEKEKMYIDTRTEKNNSFIEKKLFERKLAEQLKKEEIAKKKEDAKQRKIESLNEYNRYQSLRMSLVWHFCPNTRDIASAMAVQDGHLCSLLIKDSDADEELTQKEEIKVNSYRKNMWATAGTEELKEGHKKAKEILSQYYKNGIDSIEDEEIKQIIKQYENS